MKHFNKGVVRGRIHDLTVRKTKENERPYAELKLICPNAELGDVLAYGRLYGESTVEALKAAHKDEPGRPWKFTGRFEQFLSRGKVLSGFILLKFEPCEDAELRTAFILTGELMGKEYPDDTPDFTVLNLKVVQGRGERTEEKTFRLYAPWSMAEGMDVGAVYQLNGRIVDEDREFGSSGVTMPLVMVVKARQDCKAG